jgi:hypothetical protein
MSDQLDATITILLIFKSAQHVSSSFSHLQERKTVVTAVWFIVLMLQ